MTSQIKPEVSYPGSPQEVPDAYIERNPYDEERDVSADAIEEMESWEQGNPEGES